MDYINLRTFFNDKILKPQEIRWWEKLSGLDLAIEYQEGKSNSADALSRWSNYYWNQIKQEFVKMYCVLGYVTWESMKSQRKAEDFTWRAIKDELQAFKDAKVKSGSNHELENQFAKQSITTKSKTSRTQNIAQSSKK